MRARIEFFARRQNWVIGRYAGQLKLHAPHSMHVITCASSAAFMSSASTAFAISAAFRFIGHALTHLPQFMHACELYWKTRASESSSRPEVVFVVAISGVETAKPIIVPPEMSFATCPFSPPQNAMRSAYFVPSGASTFFGSATASPETVVTRERRMCPFSTASAIAATVPTFSTTHPTSIGSAGGSGTTRPTVAKIWCFSLPCGYSTGSTTISTLPSMSANAFSIAAIASGLFASIAILTAGMPSTLRMISTPRRTRSARSSMRWWSAQRYGSHSAPLRMRYSQRLPGGGLSFTHVGKPAPPIPQMPASLTRARSSSFVAVFQSSGGSVRSEASKPSGAGAVVSMTTAGALPPAGPRRGSTDFTSPAAEAYTGTDMKPFFSPRSCPFAT